MQKSCWNKAEVLQGSDTKPKVFSARLIKKCSVRRCECVHRAVGGKYSVSVGPRMGNCRRGASLHPRTPRLTAFSVSVSAAPWPALSHADNTANTLFQIIVNNGNTLNTLARINMVLRRNPDNLAAHPVFDCSICFNI